MLFAGVLAAGNIQRPKLGGDAVRRQRRLLRDRGSLVRPALRGLRGARGGAPAHVAAHDRTQSRLAVHAVPEGERPVSVQIRRLRRAIRTTSEAFVVPASTVTNGFGGGWEYRRGGYSVVRERHVVLESSGGATGASSRIRRRARRYVKYSASISRDFYFNVFHKVHLNGAWFGGRDLDRFAKYQFGMFDDTRIHGVPASGARFEELGMMRGSYSFNIFEQYRLDLFLEQAWGRDRALDRGVAADHRYRRRGEPARAMGYDSPRGRRQELPSGALSGDWLGHAADPAAQAAPLTTHAHAQSRSPRSLVPLPAAAATCGS